MRQVQAVSSADFIDTIGVNTHLSWINTPYWDFDRIKASLDYLNIFNVRDVITSWSESRIDALGKLGYDFSFIIGDFDLQYQLRAIEARADLADYVEGPNEGDNWPMTFQGKTGFEATAALMPYLRAWIDASPTLGDAALDVPLAQTTFGKTNQYSIDWTRLDYADVANAHSYAAWGWNPSRTVDDRIREAKFLSPGDPIISTEAGWHTAVNNPWWTGVSEEVQAKYTMTLLFEQAVRGVDRTYLYALLDRGVDPAKTDADTNFGLFYSDGRPKPVATALHHMTEILAPSQEPFDVKALGVEIDGLPSTADSYLLQTGPDTFVLAVWNDELLWNEKTGAPIVVADRPISVRLGQAVDVQIFDPMRGSDRPVADLDATSGFTVSLPTHPLLIRITVQDGGADAPPDGPDFGVLFGTPGDDVMIVDGTVRSLDGVGGVDTLDFSATTRGVALDLADGAGVATGAEIGAVSVRGFENLTGGSGHDALTGDAGDNILRGNSGRDLLRGGAGDDTLDGGGWNDRLLGEDGGDLFLASQGDDRYDGGAGVDTVSYAAMRGAVSIRLGATDGVGEGLHLGRHELLRIENAIGGAGHDFIEGDLRANALVGGAGRDTIFGGGGNDVLDGGAGQDYVAGVDGDDVFLASAGADHYNGGGGVDTVSYAAMRAAVSVTLGHMDGRATGGDFSRHELLWIDNVVGGSGNDRLTGHSGDNLLRGGGGNDVLDGGGGRDRMEGGAGADVFRFKEGAVRILDFELGVDRLALDPAAPLAMEQTGAGVTLSLAGGSVFMAGLSLHQIDLDQLLIA